MIKITFAKILSKNDVGETKSHQAGICIPKTYPELLGFFPALDPEIKNDDEWIVCYDDNHKEWHFRYIYYNNKLHDPKGTRNEFRLTHTTNYLKSVGARSGDKLVLSKRVEGAYDIGIIHSNSLISESRINLNKVKLQGWSRVH